MKKILCIAVTLAFLVLCSPSYAQIAVPMSNWKVENPDARDASEVTARDMTIRIYSTVVWENVNKEIAGVSMDIRSLANMPNDQNITLRVIYDDGMIESVRLEFPGTNSRVSTTSTDLIWQRGRLVKAIELSHGRSGGRYNITSFSYTAAPSTAVYIHQSNLAGARLQKEGASHNDVLVVRGGMRSDEWPYVTNVSSNRMQLVASVTGFIGRNFHQTNYNLTVQVLDKQGSTLRTLRVPLDLAVDVAEVDLSDMDASLIDRIVFFSNYSGIQFAIRQINFGPAVAQPAQGCPGLREVNQRFEQKIDQWKNEGMIGNRYIQELESILRELRQLE